MIVSRFTLNHKSNAPFVVKTGVFYQETACPVFCTHGVSALFRSTFRRNRLAGCWLRVGKGAEESPLKREFIMFLQAGRCRIVACFPHIFRKKAEGYSSANVGHSANCKTFPRGYVLHLYRAGRPRGRAFENIHHSYTPKVREGQSYTNASTIESMRTAAIKY